MAHTCETKADWGPKQQHQQQGRNPAEASGDANMTPLADHCGNIVSHHHHHPSWSTNNEMLPGEPIAVQRQNGSNGLGNTIENGPCRQLPNTPVANYVCDYGASPNSSMQSPTGLRSCSYCETHKLPDGGSMSSSENFKAVDVSVSGLQSNFSGDSLDLNHDDSAVAVKRMMESKSKDLENSLTVALKTSSAEKEKANTSIIVEAEKPYAVDVQSTAGINGIKYEHRVMNIPMKPSTAADPCENCETTAPSSSNSNSPTNGKAAFPSCTAFTIDFGDAVTPNNTRKLDIKDSISKFAPAKSDSEVRFGHRRNLSLPKVLDCFSDENGNSGGKRSSSDDDASKKGSEGNVTPEKSHSPTAGIIAAARARLSGAAGLKGGYLSEGHVSSDQDDELSAKSDPTRMTSRTDNNVNALKVVGHPVKFSKKSHRDGLTEKSTRRSLPVAGLRDSAKYLINKMFGEVTAPPTSPTSPVTPLVPPLNIKNAAKVGGGQRGVQEQALLPPDSNPLSKTDKSGSRSSLTSTTTYVVNDKKSHNPVSKTNLNPINNAAEKDIRLREITFSDDDDDDDEGEDKEDVDEVADNDTHNDENDVASETGTYTIEKEQVDDREEVKARKDIDVVFGVTGDYVIKRPVVVDINESVELRSKSAGGSSVAEKRAKTVISSKGNPSWLRDWVALSADKQATTSPIVSPPEIYIDAEKHFREGSLQGGFVSPSVVPGKPSTPDGQRQRRKLPVPPVEKVPLELPISALHTNGNGNSLNERVASPCNDKPRASSSSSRTSPEGRRSDSSMDTATILKETETVVTAMEARMDHTRYKKGSRVGAPFTQRDSRDSGGESDVDTSTASAVNDVDEGRYERPSINKRLNEQLKSQLKVLEVNNRNSAGGRTIVRSRPIREARSSSGGSHGRNTPTGDFGGNMSEVETASVHSDLSSSSDLSGSSPASKRKGGDRAPLMRFNRAFSLRRARLGCESDGGGHPPQKVPPSHAGPPSSRPSSASSVGSNKDRTKRITTSSKSDSGTPQINTPSSLNVGCGGAFNRSDGGRFSLRMPRSAPVPVRHSNKLPPPSLPHHQGSGRPKSATTLSNSKSAARSNSTLSAKELEMKNWKRRKEYDPLKAAAEGRKKEAAKKTGGHIISLSSKSESPSPTSTSFQRSASFHGTDGLIQNRRHTFTLDDDDEDSIGAEGFPNSGGAILRNNVASSALNNPQYESTDAMSRSRVRRSSEDESTSEAIRAYSHTDLTSETIANTSPRGSPMLQNVMRHKSKIDALDNLVISTVHQMSCNLRSNAENIIKKLSEVHGQECSQTLGEGGVDDIITKLANVESPVSSPQGRGISKQLSGILKNMKRLEETLTAVDKVLDVVPVTEDPVLQRCDGSATVTNRSGDGSSSQQQKWNGFQSRDYY